MEKKKNIESIIILFIGLVMIAVVYYIIYIATIGKIIDNVSGDEMYKSNIENLDKMSKSLNEISKNISEIQLYIAMQKQKYIYEQEAINNLKNEKETIALLAESDRKVVEALFLEQEKRQQKSMV